MTKKERNSQDYFRRKDERLAAVRKWREENPEKQKAYQKKYQKKSHYRRLYGLTQEQVDTMLAEQGGVCAICKGVSNQMCVDHDHVTRRVRGVLCRNCNLALGHIKDRPAVAEAMALYLRR